VNKDESNFSALEVLHDNRVLYTYLLTNWHTYNRG